ncbi:predicted protein [Pyrenophora tritici-repentis Pt-1C-BFP]|uniref:Uncharacterized protein n=1 Tax=Pyrenophora tritici-repentis (strain Pt-1C-BFP) TaxID=426418 RepID=B2WKF2_PYRTR|nr:uncharacterized protein PTRG_10462 [Pyrenophora tritici-repentis Pt-1C-BFP]EDU43512.1 predicted protein [Pyrenophora tritici-repentis Pt-1C-BFP]
MSATSPNQDAAPSYDRDAIVASIARYYELLSKMVSIKPKDIAYAGQGGRSDSMLSLSKLRLLGFNERMIDFIRHVPFSHSSDRPAFPYTTTRNYYTNLFRYPEEDYMLEDPHRTEMWPFPGAAGLETWWMLDTNNGELTPHGPSTEWEVPEDEEWRTSSPMPTTAYFEGLCEDLISLKMIPVPGGPGWDYWEIWTVPEGGHLEDRSSHNHAFLTWTNEAKTIYPRCHWPDLRYFQRARCRRLLLDLRKGFEAYEREGKAMSPRLPASTGDTEKRPPTPPVLELEEGYLDLYSPPSRILDD